MNDEEQRDNNADRHPDFDAPDNRQRKSKECESEVDPRSHPTDERTVKCAYHLPGEKKTADLQ